MGSVRIVKKITGGLANMSPLQSFPSPFHRKIVVSNASQTRINCRGIQNTWHRQTITFASCTSVRPISVEVFMHDLKLLFVCSEWKWTEICKVHYPIHSFTFVIVGGLCPTPPLWGTSRSINWGVDNITGGFNPQPPTIITLCMGIRMRCLVPVAVGHVVCNTAVALRLQHLGDIINLQ